jgi:hypothetical protein
MPGDGERSDQELGRTATAPGSSKAPRAEAPALGDTLGRYRLERELGAGGMGVVHAAFDPDLERRVALKVLRTVDSDEARQRLLREARALARLTHPNVVTVHEVGSAAGRDYVAMELIEGETLDDWLKAAPRSEHDITGVFVAAGRGLAAAHAAGLVHRDFKPHNVLRRKDGRIVVTDFGLARGIEAAIELEATVRLKAGQSPNDATSSSLGVLTQTGSVLGTPAYMAPEQWNAQNVGPAADQFAFCVALWEALAGQRPFKGATLDALQAAVRRGPSELDDSKLPRRLRAALKRGLDPSPDRRWPSMDALLGAITRADRPRGVLLTIAGAAVIATGVAYAVFVSDDKDAVVTPTCEVPVLDPAVVWSPSIANQVRDKTSSEIMRRFDSTIGSWQSARTVACGLDTPMRARRLGCLDGVIARLDAVRKASVLAKQPRLDEVSMQLIDPDVCNVDDPPRLPTKLSDAVVAAFALSYEPDPDADFDTAAEAAVLKQAGDDRCAQGLVKLARAEGDETAAAREAAEEAVQLAETCGDERMRADALILTLAMQITVFLDPKLQKALTTAETAVRKVSQPELVARLDLIKAAIGNASQQYDEAIKLCDSAIRGFGEHMPLARLETVLLKARLLENRRQPDDMKAARAELARWRDAAGKTDKPRLAVEYDLLDATLQWQLGDVAGANARLPALREQAERTRRKPLTGGDQVTGVVVDGSGKPVADAVVVAGARIAADTISIGYADDPRNVRMARTDAQGRFQLDHVPKDSIIAAQHGELRSHVRPATQAERLVLQPTTLLAGKLSGGGNGKDVVFAIHADRDLSPMYQIVSPVAADGSYTMRVPIAKLRVGAAQFNGGVGQAVATQEVVVGPKGRSDLEIRRAEPRKLRVIARSAVNVPLTGASVFVVSGTVVAKTVKDLEHVVRNPGVAVDIARPLTGETPPELGKLSPGDLVATFASAPLGVATACAFGFSGDYTDPAFRKKLQDNVDKLAVACAPVAPDSKAVTVEIPPMKRID